MLPSDSGSVSRGLVTALIAAMDALNEGPIGTDVFVLGTTNQPAMVDPGVLSKGRIDRLLFVGPPHPDGRRSIIRRYAGQESVFRAGNFGHGKLRGDGAARNEQEVAPEIKRHGSGCKAA